MFSLMRSRALAVVLMVGLLMASAPDAAATTLVALIGDISFQPPSTLVLINVERRIAERRIPIRGITLPLTGIDVRPANGQLYGLVVNGQVVTIDLRTGVATPVGVFPGSGDGGDSLILLDIYVDIDPVADEMRTISSNGTNIRYSFRSGKRIIGSQITFDEQNPFDTGQITDNHDIAAIAHTNSRTNAGATQLLVIDRSLITGRPSTSDIHFERPLNSGKMIALNQQPFIPLSGFIGFDVGVDSNGNTRAWLVTGNSLLELDLFGDIISNNVIQNLCSPLGCGMTEVRDIAVLP